MRTEYVYPVFLPSLLLREDVISLAARPILIMDALPATTPSHLPPFPHAKSPTAMPTQQVHALAAPKDML